MLLIDSADIEQLAGTLPHPSVSGFTTNPTLVARAAGAELLPVDDYLQRTRQLCLWAAGRPPPENPRPRNLMLQGIGTAREIVDQGKVWQESIVDSRWTLWVKVVPTEDSLASIPRLRACGIATLVTAVYTPAQAYLACEAGADGIAIYLGRLRRQVPEWRETVSDITDVVRRIGAITLLASFPDVGLVAEGLRYSSHVTIPPQLLPDLLVSPATTEAIDGFAARIVRPG